MHLIWIVTWFLLILYRRIVMEYEKTIAEMIGESWLLNTISSSPGDFQSVCFVNTVRHFWFYLSVLFFSYTAINEQAQPLPSHATPTHIFNTFLLLSHLICRQIFRASGPKHRSVTSTSLHISFYIPLDLKKHNMFLLKTCPLPGLTHWQINLISLPVQCLRPCEYCRLCAFLHFRLLYWLSCLTLTCFSLFVQRKTFFHSPFIFFMIKNHPWYSTSQLSVIYLHFILCLCLSFLYHGSFSWPLFWLSPLTSFFILWHFH